MSRTAILAAILLVSGASAAAAQQAAVPTPQKPVHPTPVPVTACRGCTDAMTDKATSVKGYDDKTADTTRKPTASTKVKQKTAAAKRTAVKSKASSKTATKGKTHVAAKRRPKFKEKPAVLDPLILPHAASTTKAKSDTTRK